MSSTVFRFVRSTLLATAALGSIAFTCDGLADATIIITNSGSTVPFKFDANTYVSPAPTVCGSDGVCQIPNGQTTLDFNLGPQGYAVYSLSLPAGTKCYSPLAPVTSIHVRNGATINCTVGGSGPTPGKPSIPDTFINQSIKAETPYSFNWSLAGHINNMPQGDTLKIETPNADFKQDQASPSIVDSQHNFDKSQINQIKHYTLDIMNGDTVNLSQQISVKVTGTTPPGPVPKPTLTTEVIKNCDTTQVDISGGTIPSVAAAAGSKPGYNFLSSTGDNHIWITGMSEAGVGPVLDTTGAPIAKLPTDSVSTVLNHSLHIGEDVSCGTPPPPASGPVISPKDVDPETDPTGSAYSHAFTISNLNGQVNSLSFPKASTTLPNLTSNCTGYDASKKTETCTVNTTLPTQSGHYTYVAEVTVGDKSDQTNPITVITDNTPPPPSSSISNGAIGWQLSNDADNKTLAGISKLSEIYAYIADVVNQGGKATLVNLASTPKEVINNYQASWKQNGVNANPRALEMVEIDSGISQNKTLDGKDGLKAEMINLADQIVSKKHPFLSSSDGLLITNENSVCALDPSDKKADGQCKDMAIAFFAFMKELDANLPAGKQLVFMGSKGQFFSQYHDAQGHNIEWLLSKDAGANLPRCQQGKCSIIWENYDARANETVGQYYGDTANSVAGTFAMTTIGSLITNHDLFRVAVPASAPTWGDHPYTTADGHQVSQQAFVCAEGQVFSIFNGGAANEVCTLPDFLQKTITDTPSKVTDFGKYYQGYVMWKFPSAQNATQAKETPDADTNQTLEETLNNLTKATSK